MTEKLNISKHSRTVVNHQPLLIISWDHFEILATGRSDVHCKIKETLLIKDLKPALNENVGSEKLFSVLAFYIFSRRLSIGLYIIIFFCFTIVIIRFRSFSLLHLNLIVLYPTVTSEDVC